MRQDITLKEASPLLAFHTFQRELGTVQSLNALRELAEAFLRKQVGDVSVQIEKALTVSAKSSLNRYRAVIGDGLYELVIDHKHKLSEHDIVSIDLVAGLLVAVPLMRLAPSEAKLVERNEQLELIYNITESARALQPLKTTLAGIYSQFIKLFETPSFFMALYEAETDLLSFPFAINNQEEWQVEDMYARNTDSLTGWVVLHKQAYATADWWNDDKPVRGVSANGMDTPRSVICVPMVSGDEVVGALSVQSDVSNAFSESAFHLLVSIADHIAIIVKNARLYSKTQELVDVLAGEYLTSAAMRQAIATIGTSLELDVILEHVLVALGELIDYDSASIGVFEHGEYAFRAHRPFEVDEVVMLSRANAELRENSLLWEVMRRKKPLVIGDVQQDSRWQPMEGMAYVHSWLGVPLMARDELVGILTVDGVEPNRYGEREVWVVATLATHAALAIQNARFYQEIERQVVELTTVYEASATMSANLDLDVVLQTVVREMVKALEVDSCTIFVYAQGLEELETAAHYNRLSSGGQAGLSRLAALGDYPFIKAVLTTQQPRTLRLVSGLDDDERNLLEAAGLTSLLVVPLIQRNKLLGLFAMGQESSLREFSEGEIRLARSLARQAGVAIENAELYTQAQRRVDELSAFQDIVLQINSPLDIEVVLNSITESALRLIGASNLHIYIYDEEMDAFTFCSALWRNGRRTPAVSSPRPDGITARVVHSGESIVVDKATVHPLFQDQQTANWGIEAIAGFPLKHGERVIGVFTVTYLEPHIFSPDEILLMNLLAEQSAVAIENARLYTEARRRLQDTSAMVDMAKQVTGNLKVDLVMQTTVQVLRRLFNARACAIAILSEDRQELVIEAAEGIQDAFLNVHINVSQGVSGQVVATRQPVYVVDSHKQSNFLLFDQSVRSLLIVPLISRDEVVGTLAVDSDRPHAFRQTDIQLMTIAAAQVSVAMTNAQFFEELENRAGELTKAYDELKEVDKLKDELVQNVSHELRTPLTFVRGYVDLLMDGEMGDINKSQGEALHIVSEKTDEITRLVDDIMALQRIDRENLVIESFSMFNLVESAISCHVMNVTEHGLKLDSRLSNSAGLVMGDRGRVNQVLDNLIGNSIKFSPNGGTITVRMTERKNDVVVVIEDEGIGIPEDKLAKIFERFYQVDGSSRRRFGGAGLGLAIVQRIVQSHGGHIWVQSKEDEGSSFYFTLPK